MDLNHCLRIDNKRIVEEIEREIPYMFEKKTELERNIRELEASKKELIELEKKIQVRMVAWLSIKEEI